MLKLRIVTTLLTLLFLSQVVIHSTVAGSSPLPKGDSSVVLVIDTSDSMSGIPLAEAVKAATHFVETANRDIPIALMTFNGTVTVHENFTTDREILKAKLAPLLNMGPSALYDAALESVKLAATSSASQRYVVFLTDSMETEGLSEATREAALEAARAEGITVITIAYGAVADRAYLTELAEGTNGQFHDTEKPQEFLPIFSTLGENLTTTSSTSTVADSTTILPLTESIAELPLLAIDAGIETLSRIAPSSNTLSILQEDVTTELTNTEGEIAEAQPIVDTLTSNIVPITITIEEPQEVVKADLSINNQLLTSFTEPPYEYDLDTTLLESGTYNFTLSVTGSNNVVSTGSIGFEVEVLNQPALPEVEEGVEAVGNVDQEVSEETTSIAAPVIRRLTINGEAQAFNFVFSLTNGLTVAIPESVTSQPNNLGDILSQPLKYIPQPVKDAVVAKNPTLWSVVIIIMTLTLLPQGIFTLYWMLYTWNNPEAAEQYKSPKEYLTPQFSFTALLPARKEQDVIKDTIKAVDRIDYPDHLKEILVLIRDEDDDETIARTKEAIEEIGKDHIHLITFTDGPKNKPNGLNRGLKVASKDVICIFDAEDEPHPELYNIINTVMVRDDADVVQSGVQLMNYKSTWFSALNCLEYFFWFKSGLHAFTRKFKVTPLGGNTVFFKRYWLERINGWDEGLLTEDADVGIRLTLLGAKIQIVYDEKHATQEETPHNVDSFIKQRTRWCQGFYEIFFKGDWIKLPTLTQKITALYILLNSLMQALIALYLPVGIYIALTQEIPVPVALISYVPIFLLLLQMVTNLIGIREFTAAYNQRMPFLFTLKMIVFYYPFQLLLTLSAFRAVRRFIGKKNAWEKTEHSNLHRQAGQHAARPVQAASAPQPEPVVVKSV
jgi:glycosyltransferase XagB